jgi:beta-N-acetylhexosaminidase
MSAQVGAIEQVVQAVKSGEISQDAIQTSVSRVEELKRKYLSSLRNSTTKPALLDMEATNKRHSALASKMYSKSTTVVRSVPGCIPISKGLESKILCLLPGKTPVGSGAVGSGEEKTREPYLKKSITELLEARHPGMHVKQYYGPEAPDPDAREILMQADIVLLCTRNASLNQYQKDFGLAIGKILGKRLIVVATCDPYDFLDDVEIIKNYITTYEPTLEAFSSALNVIFGTSPAIGSLPIGLQSVTHEIRTLDSSSEHDVTHIWNLWQEIFPTWSIERKRLELILTRGNSTHLIHEKGFCLAYFNQNDTGSHGIVSVIGVLEAYRGRGIGTALINKVHEALKARTDSGKLTSFSIKSSFPRFWPGVPINLPSKDRDFFLHRGESSIQALAAENWRITCPLTS